MRSPKSLETLADHGIIQEVLRPLMSGKEAQIYMVVSDDRVCAAKIYKESQNRSFKHRTDYMEGRKVRNSRDQRAMAKGTAYGKSKDEDAWRTTEVDIIYRLRAAGVRVPEPYVFIDGVLLMELVCDDYGNPAPRLGDVSFTPKECTEIFHAVLQEVVRMLCAGVVHGDLSDFNVLLAHDGPVIIDFPQSVEAAGNLNARRLLLRDVDNLHRFLARFVPGARRLPYGEEIWSLYENNQLTPETRLTGTFKRSSARVDTSAVLGLIADANRDEMRRRESSNRGRPRGESPSGGAASPHLARRREVIIEKPAPRGAQSSHRGPGFSPGGPPRAGGPGGSSRPGGGRPPEANKARPKPGRRSGGAVQGSVYVSPEARKTKPLQLTPRTGPHSGSTPNAGSKPNSGSAPHAGSTKHGGSPPHGSSRPDKNRNAQAQRPREEPVRRQHSEAGHSGDGKRADRPGPRRDGRQGSSAGERAPDRGQRPDGRQHPGRNSGQDPRQPSARTHGGESSSSSTGPSTGDRRERARARREERMNGKEGGAGSTKGSSPRAPASSPQKPTGPEREDGAPRRRRRRRP